VDWRGRCGLIVAPPSQHASGHRYTWVQPLTATLPKVRLGCGGGWPHRRLRGPPSPQPRVASHEEDRAGRYAQAALQREAARVRGAAGSCNDTLNRAAFNLGQLVAAGLLDAEQVRAVLLAAALAAPATGQPDRQRRAQATITSRLRGGAAKPRQRRGGVP
jgi:Bifunctional DNA primase/polymerase, N-terminal